MTHLACADADSLGETEEQLRRFAELRNELQVDPDDLFVNDLTRRILALGERPRPADA